MRNAGRWVLAARLTESLLLAVTVWVLVLSAAILARQPLDPSGAHLAGLLAAGAAAWAYLHGARCPLPLLVRRLDIRLGQKGELATAWEGACEGSASPVLALLAQRVSRRLPRREVMQACIPNSLPYVALPLLACAALALAREARERRDAIWERALAAQLTRDLKRARSLAMEAQAEGRLGLDELRKLFATEEGARDLARALTERKSGAATTTTQAELRELAAGIADLTAKLDPQCELARALERARAAAEASQLGAESVGSGVGGEGARRAPVGAETEGHARAQGTEASGTSDGSLTGGGPAGRMSGSSEATTGPAADPGPGDSAVRRPAVDRSAPGGPTLGRAWRAEDAAIVEAWVERRSATPPDQAAAKEND
jgi:hypothetical protein